MKSINIFPYFFGHKRILHLPEVNASVQLQKVQTVFFVGEASNDKHSYHLFYNDNDLREKIFGVSKRRDSQRRRTIFWKNEVISWPFIFNIKWARFDLKNLFVEIQKSLGFGLLGTNIEINGKNHEISAESTVSH